MVRYAILGEIQLCNGEHLPAGGPQQIKLLAFLLVHANRAVSAEELLETLSGEQLAPGGLKRVRMAIARLRKTLDRPDRRADEALRTVAGGYLLRVAAGELDAHLFETQVHEGRQALAGDQAQLAADVLGRALRLWRGPPLADVRYEDWAQHEIRRLEDLRLAAIEHRVEADLRLGRHTELTSELEMLLSAHPSRERLAELLMLALYRCGRQEEALAAYGRMRARLTAELGLEPGPALKLMQANILEQSPSLDPPTERTTSTRPAADIRRPVTALVACADLGDPEALHSLYERFRPVIERYGGAVQRYLGDALVGLFGCTESSGEDALRATRAAEDLRAEHAALRVGIESGEVFLRTEPDGAVSAIGAAITEAGTFAQRAAPGEILLGDAIRHAVRTNATVDPATGRLVALQADRPALLRVAHTPFIGRARELEVLDGSFARVREDRVCRLVTLVGPPGIGKSRLAAQFLTTIADEATVLAGRCLAYGEGSTYLALADIVRQLGGDPRQRLSELLPDDDHTIRGTLAAIGQLDEPAQPEETSSALRRLLERLARDRPVVIAIEDAHWADPMLLDLLEHIVALSSHAPILMLCLTRPELLETRPIWAAPHPSRSVIVLDGLAEADAYDLARGLGARTHAAQIARRAEGSPLFIEQLVAVDVDVDGSELPASIRSALAARIDRLRPEERALLQRAAVEGRTFHSGALRELLPKHARQDMTAHLVALAHKGLIAPDRPEQPGEDAFRFMHELFRDAAYARLPKLQRSKLHARLADWLEQRPLPADEVVGYHLEQACLLARSLGYAGEQDVALCTRAADRLQAAANAARARGEASAACALLRRAVALVQSDESRRAALLPTLGAALLDAGRLDEAAAVLDEAIDEAFEPRYAARARIERELVLLGVEPTASRAERSLRIADDAVPPLLADDDRHGASRAWSLRAHVAWTQGRVADAEEAWREAAHLAVEAGDDRERFHVLGWQATAMVLGPTPVPEAIARCHELRQVVRTSPVAEMWIVNPLAVLYAMKGDFERADHLLRDANTTLSRLGGLDAAVSHHEAFVRLLQGRPDLAEIPLRQGAERLAEMNAQDRLATTTAMLAQALYAQERIDEAESMCAATARTAASDDIVTQVIWRGVSSKILAREGHCADAQALARAAISLLRSRDVLSHQGDAMVALAEVLKLCGDEAASRQALAAGIELFQRKGNITAVRQAARSAQRIATPEERCRTR